MIRGPEIEDAGRGEIAAIADKALSAEPGEIVYRRMKFDLGENTPRYWHSNSPYITSFYTALSMLFPEGEKFFIESVRAFDSDLHDPLLREQVKKFSQQEAHHSVQHRLLNELMAKFQLKDLPQRVTDQQRVSYNRIRRRFSKLTQLTLTVVDEHFTATFAHEFLTNKAASAGMHASVLPLWRWHCIEETEHKAVAFDVYTSVGGGYGRRVGLMAIRLLTAPLGIAFWQVVILARDGKLFDARDLTRFLVYMFGHQGVARGMWRGFKGFFRREFHPWQLDNRRLLKGWKEEIEPFIVESQRRTSPAPPVAGAGGAETSIMSREQRRVVSQYDRTMFARYNRLHFRGSGFFNWGYWLPDTRSGKTASENLVEQLLAFIPDKQGTILDVACGLGATTHHMLKYYAPEQVTATNISAKQLEAARKNAPGCTFRLMDAARMDFPDESFDNIICVESAFHFETRERFYAEAFRILKPGGRLVTSDILHRQLMRRIPANSALHPSEIRDLLRAGGFDEVKVVDATEQCWRGFRRNFARAPRRWYDAGEINGFDLLLASLYTLSYVFVAGLGMRYYVLTSARKPLPEVRSNT